MLSMEFSWNGKGLLSVLGLEKKKGKHKFAAMLEQAVIYVDM